MQKCAIMPIDEQRVGHKNTRSISFILHGDKIEDKHAGCEGAIEWENLYKSM